MKWDGCVKQSGFRNTERTREDSHDMSDNLRTTDASATRMDSQNEGYSSICRITDDLASSGHQHC
jgi:hypothetical protein